jgi:SnoaL-like protein
VDRAEFTRWIEAYERAWRSPGTGALDRLFTPEATYRNAPFAEPVVGQQALAAFWEAERDGPDEPFTMRSELVAVEGAVGVARVEVTYASPSPHLYRDLWVITLGPDGRCSAFEEWPFFPGQPLSAGAVKPA